MLGPGVPFTGRVVVRLIDSVAEAVRSVLLSTPSLAPQGLGSVLSATPQTPSIPDLAALQANLAQYNGALAKSPVPPAYIHRVGQWEDESVQTLLPRQHTLFAYWILDLRGTSTSTPIASIIATLRNIVGVDTAYQERNLRDPAWVVTPDTRTAEQDYVYGLGNESPRNKFGVNANHPAVWQQFSGAGVGFVDIERGWRFTHQDFPARAHSKNPDPNGDGTLIGANVDNAKRHGTQAVCVAVGKDHAGVGLGIVGIAAGAKLLGVASRVSDDLTDEWQLTAAISAARDVMTPGDVLLIEAETAGAKDGGYPVEVDSHHFDAIRLACATGIVVVEAAGNGWSDVYDEYAHDLDDAIPPRPGNVNTPVLNRNDAAFTDSGAIMVGSCASLTHPGKGHERDKVSSYGSRIDCYAWGELVLSPNTDGANPDADYSLLFGGTSAASAIIAGVALVIQEMASQSAFPKNRLSPTALRALLQRADLGTAIYEIGATASTPPIGRMPDLARISGEFNNLPDVFVRDAIGDDGSIPSLNLAQSPDIIVRSSWNGTNPDALFGEPSGYAEVSLPNDDIKLNATNYLFVRMRNRGLTPANGVVATLYWAEAGAMVPPVAWNLIGSTAPVNVPPAVMFGSSYGALTVAGPIQWTPNASTLPVQHACFIAVLHHELDPAPPPLATLSSLTKVTWDTFFAMVQGQNNVAWRNFNVMKLSPFSAGWLMSEAVFNLYGPPGESAIFDFEVDRRGSLGQKWRLVVPHVLRSHLTRDAEYPVPEIEEERDGLVSVPVEASGLSFASVRLDAGARYRCRVQVLLGEAFEGRPGSLSILQRYRGRVVGRLSFVLPSRAPDDVRPEPRTRT